MRAPISQSCRDPRLRPRADRARAARLDALIARAVALHPAGFAVLDPAMLAAADPEIAERAAVAGRLVSRRVRAIRPRTARLARLLRGARRGAAAGPHARRLPFRALARPGAGIARIGSPPRRRSRSNRAPICCWDRRFAVIALVASNRPRSRSAISGRRGARRRRGGFGANTAASCPFRAAGVLGRGGHRGGASSRLSPARVAVFCRRFRFGLSSRCHQPSFTVV